MAFISDRHVFVFKNTYVDYDTTYDDEVDCSGDGGGGGDNSKSQAKCRYFPISDQQASSSPSII
ncbi:hypothetical protein DERF_001879 [Dermatophagoides farinae]|uniref:Uncharacterized protein n=1 Tax=Dermatophagoides farinae TaxID=6954 RepID=A0A922LD46_DERFA|nr:hypothetical protein DERF_001879 [Dermatophagoides farinae]